MYYLDPFKIFFKGLLEWVGVQTVYICEFDVLSFCDVVFMSLGSSQRWDATAQGAIISTNSNSCPVEVVILGKRWSPEVGLLKIRQRQRMWNEPTKFRFGNFKYLWCKEKIFSVVPFFAWIIAVSETKAVWCLSWDKMIWAPAYSWKCQMVIGQGWIALKPEYCIRERQLVRSQNRLSYARGWVKRGGGGRATEAGMESRGREWGAQEEETERR